MKTLLNIGYILLAVLFIDFLGFMLWATSGQVAPDNFYVGSLTAHVLGAVL
jgi:hypothetical protein